jgi:hypothetical protein
MDTMKMTLTGNYWALLWSRSQGALHIETLLEAIANGLAMLQGEEEPNDYILVYVGPTRESVEKIAEHIRPIAAAKHEADTALGLAH